MFAKLGSLQCGAVRPQVSLAFTVLARQQSASTVRLLHVDRGMFREPVDQELTSISKHAEPLAQATLLQPSDSRGPSAVARFLDRLTSSRLTPEERDRTALAWLARAESNMSTEPTGTQKAEAEPGQKSS